MPRKSRKIPQDGEAAAPELDSAAPTGTAEAAEEPAAPQSTAELPSSPSTPAGAESSVEPPSHAAGESSHSFVERANPNGPRILPVHVRIIHDGRGEDPPFEMGEDHVNRRMVIGFRGDPGQEIKNKLTERRQISPDGPALNFQYDDRKHLWHIEATPDGRERASQAVNDISGKDIRFGFGRGRS